MSRYRIEFETTISGREYYTAHIEADSEDEAEELFWNDLWDWDYVKDDMEIDSVGDIEIGRILCTKQTPTTCRKNKPG